MKSSLHTLPTLRRPWLLCFGEVLWDMLPSGFRLGGAPANCAVHAHDAGLQTWIVSARGEDELGFLMAKELTQRGIPLRFLVPLPGLATGTVKVHLVDRSSPHYEISSPAAWDSITISTDLLSLAADVDALHYGTLAQRSTVSRQALHALLAATRRDCIRFFDINLRAPHYSQEIVADTLASATILKLNHEELPILASLCDIAPKQEAAVISELFRRHPLQMIVLTRGERGATLATRNQVLDIPACPPRTLIDTVGAGDAFSAAFLHGILTGKKPFEAGKAGAQLASRVCEVAGAWLPLPLQSPKPRQHS